MATKTKDKAFALFTLDKKPSDPEVKALGIKSSTRHNYFSEWKRLGKPSPDVPEAELGLLGVPKKAREKKALAGTVILPGHETIGAYRPEVSEAGGKPEADKVASEASGKTEANKVASEAAAEETKLGSETAGAGNESEGKPKIPIDLGDDHERRSIPEKVVGAGLPVTVNLSLKTLSFYEIAATIDPKLTLGDFLDACTEDFFQGRGKDLGLIQIGGGNA